MYLINALLVLMVIRQVREHSLDLRALAVPLLAVAAAAVMFLHWYLPAGTTSRWSCSACRLARPWARRAAWPPACAAAPTAARPACACALAASMWVAGTGARMAFAFAATHGAGPAIRRFTIAHHITGSAAWVAALVMMALADVLTRLVVVWLRGRRLAAVPAAPALIPAGTPA